MSVEPLITDDIPLIEKRTEIVDVEEEHDFRKKRVKLDEIEKRAIPNLGALRSSVYANFHWVPEVRQWKCKICPDIYYNHSTRGGSGSLQHHLERQHPTSLEPQSGNTSTSRKSISNFVVRTPRSNDPAPEPITTVKFRKLLLEFIVSSDQPFSVVQDGSFRNLLHFCTRGDEKAKLPCAQTIRNLISAAFVDEKTKLKYQFNANKGKISFVIDCWTSSNQKAFQGVVASWINNDWKLCNCAIDLTILEGAHTGANIADAFGSVITEFNLWHKILAVTTDNASNMDTMFHELDNAAVQNLSEFQAANYRVRCLAHIINLSCKDIIKKVVGETNQSYDDIEEFDDEEGSSAPLNIAISQLSFVCQLRKCISAVRSSPQRRELFKKFCEKLCPEISCMLILDVDTRWNSTLEMLERALHCKPAFIATVATIKKFRNFNLDEDEIWERVAALIKLLQPFAEATKMISQSHSPSLSDTATVYNYLFEELEGYMDEDSNVPNWVKEAATVGWQKLQKYFPTCESTVYIAATAMNPRCKLTYFKKTWEKQFYEAARKKLSNVWSTKYKSTSVSDLSNLTENKKSETSKNIQKSFDKKMKEFQQQEDELKHYLKASVISSESIICGVEGSLDWWKTHERDYPNLSKMAKDFLAVPASGVPVERLFSTGPDLLSHRRQQLTSQTIKECMCLKQWFKKGDDIFSNVVKVEGDDTDVNSHVECVGESK